ncbi:hypothetical protein ACHHYP_12376 [Achlya hypogyna]|uniref:Uncharacterized protein n=1 Tax=Achlya hypogyna TaxID=1202772 RepID=A0A1V9YH80_ACHHY|nr:hypothetical protein ACHHYP_12376 [Achlya hypogyna]
MSALDALEPVLAPLPRVVCMPSAATLNASIPMLHVSDEQRRRLRALRHHAFRRVQENHLNCVAILHGSLQAQPVVFMDKAEEEKELLEEERLREQIKALQAENKALEADFRAIATKNDDNLAKRNWADLMTDSIDFDANALSEAAPKRLKVLTSL